MANERRLIDANRLALEFISRFCGADTDLPPDMQIALKLLIDEQPTVDAVEVVRCKDCRFAHKVDSPYKVYGCEKAAYNAPWFNADEFCSRGEKREVE